MGLAYRLSTILATAACLIASPIALAQTFDFDPTVAEPGLPVERPEPTTLPELPASPTSGPGCVTACVECGKLYASDLDGKLWSIDPVSGVATFIGWTSGLMLDIGISSDGYLFGVGPTLASPTPVHRISACDASDCLDGSITDIHNSLGGDLTSTNLFAAGPPLASAGSGIPYPYTAIGGTVGSGSGQWCGLPSGDVAMDPITGNLYITLAGCSTCAGGADMLARLNTATGSATNVGCLLAAGNISVAGVFGLAFDDSGTLYGIRTPTSGFFLEIDKGSGAVTPHPMTGGPTSGTGLASISCSQGCNPDLGLPTIDCGIVAGSCGTPPFSGPDTMVVECGESICLYANASDNCGVLSLGTLQLPGTGASSPTGTPVTVKYNESFSTPGIHDVSWEAFDSHGNRVTCSTTVDVRCDQCMQIPSDATNWWPLDEIAPPVTDLAGSTANNGVWGNTPVPTSPGKVDDALCFNGVPDLVGVPNAVEVNFHGTALLGSARDFTIDLWVKTNQSRERQTLLDKRKNEQGSQFGYLLFLEAGYLGFELADGSVPLGAPSCDPNPALSHCTEWVATTAPVGDGTWHFVAVTVERFSPTGGTLWVDGAPVLTFDPTPRLGNLTNTAPLQMALENPALGTTHLAGCLDEVEFFDRALTAAEIAALHRADSEGKCKCGAGTLTAPCPIGQQEYDKDADGCMDGCICDKAFLGECSECPTTAGTCNPTGPDCVGNAILYDSNCDCVYDLCTHCPIGTYPRDTDGDGCEDICDCYVPVVVHVGPAAVLWVPSPGVVVDIVWGSVGTLKSTLGDFSEATLGCLANDAQGSSTPFTQVPPPGDGFWFLARPVTSDGFGTYDATPSSHEGRDPGIAASGLDCP